MLRASQQAIGVVPVKWPLTISHRAFALIEAIQRPLEEVGPAAAVVACVGQPLVLVQLWKKPANLDFSVSSRKALQL